MNELVTAITTAITAFTATNVDDLVILMLFFSQVNETFRRHHIVLGQYLGFSVIVVASLCGFFGGLILPQYWIELLGLIPVVIGLKLLLKTESGSQEVSAEIKQSDHSTITSFISPQTYSVAAVTLANGSDNIGVHVPLFANSNLWSLLVIFSVFFLLVGVWCYAAYKLFCLQKVADILRSYGKIIVPIGLIGLGIFIVMGSLSLTLLTLVAICLCLIIFGINNEQSHELAKS